MQVGLCLVLLYCLAAAHTPLAQGAYTAMKVGDNLKDSSEYNRCDSDALRGCFMQHAEQHSCSNDPDQKLLMTTVQPAGFWPVT